MLKSSCFVKYISVAFLLANLLVVNAKPLNSNASELKFTANKGQWNKAVQYKTEFNRGAVFLEKGGFTFLIHHKEDLRNRHALLHEKNSDLSKAVLRSHAYKVNFIGANQHALIQGVSKLEGYHNYFIGNDKSKWASNVPVYEKIRYQQVYNGIDLLVHSNSGRFKYDFIVNSGVDPSVIELSYEGLDKMKIENGHLVMKTSVGELRELAPYAYQNSNDGNSIEVACKFKLKNSKVTFLFPNGWDKSKPLIIDPVLVAATLSGTTGTENYGHSATYDSDGNMYTGGICFGTGYPTGVGSIQQNYGGGYNDISISKVSADGTTLIYATYLGGNAEDFPHSMVVSDNNELYVLGSSASTDYPTTATGFSTALNGMVDIVVSKLNPNGTVLLGSSYVGGSLDDGQNQFSWNYGDMYRGEIIVDGAGNPYISSVTSSSDFPTTAGAFQPTFGGMQDGVVFKMNSDLSSISWSTYLGGTGYNCGYGIRLDAAGDVFVCGATEDGFLPNQGFIGTYQGLRDGYVVKLTGAGSTLSASTYWGTADEDQAFFLDIDLDGDIYIYGHSQGGTSPVTAGVYANANAPQFIAKLDPTLSTNIYSTVIGLASSGFGYDFVPIAFMVDKCEYVYWSGHSTVNQLPVTSNALQTNGGFYLGVLQPDGLGLEYATHYGGMGDHVDGGTSRFDPQGIVYQAVCSNTGFNTTPGSWSSTYPTSSWGGTGYDIGVFKIDFEILPIDATASVQPSSAGCAPFTANFVNSSLGVHYIWDFNDGTPIDTAFQPTHTFANPGVYNVQLIAIDSSACITTDTTYITITVGNANPVTASFVSTIDCSTMSIQTQSTGSSGVVYQWNMGDSTTYTDSTVAHTYLSSGQYTVELIVTDTICGSSDTISSVITIEPSILADISALPDTTGCIPLDITFVNNTNGVSYSWDFADGSANSSAVAPSHTYTSAGNYLVSLIAIDSSSCNIQDTAYITIVAGTGDPVLASFSYVQNSDCDLFEIITTNTSVGNNLTFEWDMGDSTYYLDSNVVHQYSSSGVYQVTLVAYDSVCNNWDTSSVLVPLQASISLDIGDDKLICPYDTALFDAGISGVSYLWNTGDTTQVISPSADGWYSVTIFDGVCEATDSAYLSFTNYTSRSYSTEICLGEEVFLDAGGAQNYLWSTNDSSQLISVADGGSYWFEYTDDFGCTYEDTVEVIQKDVSISIFAPNAFSPDQDGYNDSWKVVGQGIEKYELYIYNRWGQLVWVSKNVDDQWDGTFKGENLPIDEYVYKLTYQNPCVGKELIEKTGHVLIIR